MNKNKYIILALITVLVAVLIFVVPLFFKKGLKSTVAQVLNTDEQYLSLNMPPLPARYPGSILLPLNGSYSIFLAGSSEDERILRGEKFDISAELDQTISGFGKSSAGILSTVFSNNEHFVIKLNITDGQILEMPIDDLKSIVLGNESARKAADDRLEPIILNRAYQGKVSYEIIAKDEKGVEILTEIKPKFTDISNSNPNLSIDGTLTTNQKLSFSLNDPIIIAYEHLGVDYVMNNLSGENGLTAELSLMSAAMMEENRLDSVIVSTQQTEIKWGLVTIGSGHFESLATMDVPEVVSSAKLVSSILGSYDPVFSHELISTEDDIIAEEEVLELSIALTLQMLDEPVDYLVVYYVGHGLSLPNGEMVLLQGDIKKDFAERIADSMTPQTSQLGDGMILVETLFSSFEVTGVPMTLILDACYPSDEMQMALDRVSMNTIGEDGTGLVYFGNQELITDEMSEISSALSSIGNRFEYRTLDNPIIFSSKPGAKALFRENPYSYFDYRLAPLASRIAKSFQGNNAFNQIPMNNLVLNITDFRNGIGEISLSGSITWSNLDVMNEKLSNVYSSRTVESLGYK